MDINEINLNCSINLEWTNAHGIVQRKITNKTASLRLIRDQDRNMFVEIIPAKSSAIKLKLQGISVHNKFMNEGKASIQFQNIRCTMLLSNAPPDQLTNFLRTIFVKMVGKKDSDLNKSLRTQVLTNTKQKQFEEISPVTNLEFDKARAKACKSTDTTPSPIRKKRKLSSGINTDSTPKSKKKLYSSTPIPNEQLDLEQKVVLDACLGGKSLFFTGSAGTGKSYLLRRIIGALPPDVTFATASTGVAACHIGGITLHQFAGIGTGEASLERCVQIASKPATAGIWRKCKHLIIDEISMVHADYFEKIETIARKVRRNDKPFGGIQLILCGDFFQLPPVAKTNNRKFCFQTKAWQNCVQITLELKRVHRQNDEEFINILNTIRLGKIPETMANRLTETAKQKIEDNGILATRLCSHTQDAKIINESKLAALSGEKLIFKAEDSAPHFSKQIDQLVQVPSVLELKLGAQVMLLKNININLGLVNGARGVIKAFNDGLPLVQFRNKEFLIKHERWMIKNANGTNLIRKQIPLQLAWAFSIHKSQGLTLDCVEMSLGKVFEAGQAYVALSRAKNLKTLRVLDFKTSQVWANPDVVKFYKEISLRMECMEMIALGKKNNNGNPKTLKRIASGKFSNKPIVVVS